MMMMMMSIDHSSLIISTIYKLMNIYATRSIPSVVPSDRSFSTSLFLTIVHGSISFNQLKHGLLHLQENLAQQSSRRENLVRTHLGLFVQVIVIVIVIVIKVVAIIINHLCFR